MPIKLKVKAFILNEFLPGAQVGELPDDLNLLENGIMDSLAVLKLVAYIENEFEIVLDPEEIDINNLHSINAIAVIVRNKKLQAA